MEFREEFKADLERFKDDVEYYADKKYLSNSMISEMIENEDLFKLSLEGKLVKELNPNFGLGNYAHEQLMSRLVEGSIDFSKSPYVVVPDYDRRNKKGKEFHEELLSSYGHEMYFIKESDAVNIDTAIDRIFEIEPLVEYLQSCEFEVPAVGEIDGVLVKGKADFIHRDDAGNIDAVIDFKTTSSLTGGFNGTFVDSAYKYNYDRQAYLYSQLFNIPMKNFSFLVLEKNGTNRVRYVPIKSANFLISGKKKLHDGIKLFKLLKDKEHYPFLHTMSL